MLTVFLVVKLPTNYQLFSTRTHLLKELFNLNIQTNSTSPPQYISVFTRFSKRRNHFNCLALLRSHPKRISVCTDPESGTVIVGARCGSTMCSSVPLVKRRRTIQELTVRSATGLFRPNSWNPDMCDMYDVCIGCCVIKCRGLDT